MKSTKTSLLKAGLCLRCWGGTKEIVFMIKGMNSATSMWTCFLYSWYINTTMIGSSCSTFRDNIALGMRL